MKMLECFKNYLLPHRGLVVVHLTCLTDNFIQLHGIYCNKLASFTVSVFQEKHCLWRPVARQLTPRTPDLEVRGSSRPLFP